MENVFGLMTTGLGKIASRAFELDTPEIPKVCFGKIRGLKPRIVGTMGVPFCTNDEASPMTTGNAKTRGTSPLVVGRTCPFPESDNPRSIGVSPISSMTIEEEGVEAT